MSREGPLVGIAARMRSAVRRDFDRAVAEAAVERGLVSAEHLEAARRILATRGQGSLRALLVDQGWIEAEALEAFERAWTKEEFARPELPRAAALPAGVAAAAVEPERNLAEFVLVSELGHGGTGQVMKAWDRSLDRWVAVKLSTAGWGSATVRERFRREAAAAASLAHPNIVPIYRTGTERGRAYIVMRLVEGATLEGRQLPVRTALEVMRATALAVAYAHAQGVVHRDLKPANIMLDPAGTVFILDFGLAFLRDDESTATRPGDVLGTAAYMSPEQVAGGTAARLPATDVYGLGATLYQVITGQPPFAGQSFARIVHKVTHSEAPSPRRLVPAIPRELEIIIAKAMDKDPGRRYESAAALAEDLRRLIEDEPIVARSRSIAGRLGRRARRRPALTALVAATAVLAVALATVGAVTSAQQAAAMNVMREVASTALDSALRLRREGNLTAARQLLARMLTAYERVPARVKQSAELEYLLGRMYRVQMDDRQALAHQEQALARNPDFAPALYERAALRAQLYGLELDRAVSSARVAGGGATAEQNALRTRPELARMREGILADCARLADLSPDSNDALAAKGLLAYHQRHYQRAHSLLAQAALRDPGREEVWLFLARAALELDRFDDADQAYARGVEGDRGFLPFWVDRCHLEERRGRRSAAVLAATTALAMSAEVIEAWLCRGNARMFEGHDAMLNGQDPSGAFSDAERDFGEVLRLQPALLTGWWGRGTVRRFRALFHLRRGQDPGPQLQGAEQDFTRAIAVDRGAAQAWTGRGRARSYRAFALAAGAGTLAVDLAAAEADLTEAIRLDPMRTDARDWRGELHAVRGRALADDPASADTAFAAAEADFAVIISQARAAPWALLHRGVMRTWRGRAHARRGADPLPDWRAAQDDLTRAILSLGDNADGWLERGVLLAERARYAGGRGSAALDLAAAERDLTRALLIDPHHVRAAVERGNVLDARQRSRPPRRN